GAGPFGPVGGLAMTMRTKGGAAIAGVVAVTAAILLWRGVPPPEPGGRAVPPPAGIDPAQPRLTAPAATDREPQPGDAVGREALAAPAAPTTGVLVVHVRWGDDHQPAPLVTMLLRRIGGEPRFDGVRR